MLDLPARYVAAETAIGMAVNAAAATIPLILTPSGAPSQPLHAAAMGMAPQIMIGAVMSVAAPSLLTGWRRRRGRIGGLPDARPTLLRTAVTALVLAAAFTAGSLSFIHLVLPTVLGESLDRPARIVLAGAQGVLAAALLTPLALVWLYGEARP